MRKMKRIAVLILCLAILCALPLSLTVGAANTVTLNKAVVIATTDTQVTLQVTFSKPVHIFNAGGFNIQPTNTPAGCNGTNPAVWQSWSPSISYVKGSSWSGGNEYSDTVNMTFYKCRGCAQAGRNANTVHQGHFWGDDGKTLPEKFVLWVQDNNRVEDQNYISSQVIAGKNGERLERDEYTTYNNLYVTPTELVSLDKVELVRRDTDKNGNKYYTFAMTFSDAVHFNPAYAGKIALTRTYAGAGYQTWGGRNNISANITHVNAETVGGVEYAKVVEATLVVPAADAAKMFANDSQYSEWGIRLSEYNTSLFDPADGQIDPKIVCDKNGRGIEKTHVASGASEIAWCGGIEMAPEVMTTTVLDADDPNGIQIMATFNKPVTMNCPTTSWAVMMRYGMAANGANNKKMVNYEYINGTVGADGKTYAKQIVYTFDKTGVSLPVSGNVGIAFAEYNYPNDLANGYVTPELAADEKGQGLTATYMVDNSPTNRVAISFVKADLAADGQTLIGVTAKNANQITVDFGMLVKAVDVSKGITLGSRTVTAAVAESPISDNYGNYGSSRWVMTLNGNISDTDTAFTIPANTLTTPYCDTVVGKELSDTMEAFMPITVTDITVDDEMAMTLTAQSEIKSLDTVVARVRMLNSSKTVMGEMKLTLTDNGDLTYTAVPVKEGNLRSFSAIYQAAVKSGYVMDVALSYSGNDLVHDFALTVDDYAFDPSAFTVVKVTQHTTNSLLVKFSGDVTVDSTLKPWICLRMINPSTGGVIPVSGISGKVMQWGSSSVENYAKDTLLITFPETTDISMLINKVNMDPAYINYPIVLCMEEANGLDPLYKGNHLMYNIRRADGKGNLKQLDVTQYKVSGATLNDAVLATVEDVANPSMGLMAEKIEVLNQTQMVVTFSEPVELNKPFVSVRPINAKNQTKTKAGTNLELFWTGTVEYHNDKHTQIRFTLHDVTMQKQNAVPQPIDGLHNILAGGFEDNEYKLKLTFMDANAAHQRVMDGVVAGITGESGTLLMSDCLTGIYDAVCMDIDADAVPKGELTITDATVISDLEAIVTFSAPIEIADRPYIGIRILNKNNQMLWRTQAGEIVYISKDADGNPTTPLQGQVTWEWYNKEHTQIIIKMTSGVEGMNNFVDMLNFDWASLGEGIRMTIGVEEKYDPAVNNNGRVDNIYMVSDPRITLLGNKFDGAYDGSYVDVNVDYTPKDLTVSAAILNDTQLRITFSQPVQLLGKDWLTLRYIDPETGVSTIWGDGTLSRTLIQFNGKWEWENNSHRSIIWTMNGNNLFGACNIADLVNHNGALELFKGYQLVLAIQECSSDDFKTSSKNGRIENFVTLDGKNRLKASALDQNLDFAYAPINPAPLKDKQEIQLLEVNAVDDQTLELVFSEEIKLGTDDKLPNFVLRYVNRNGGVEGLANGKTANFKGTVTPKAGDAKVLVFKLNSKNADSLTDIINFNGNLKWNIGARVCMVVENTAEGLPTHTKRIWGVFSTDGIRTLTCEYMKEPSITMDINVNYDLPAPEHSTNANQGEVETEFYSDYTPFILISGGMVAIGLILLVVALVVRRKKEEK